MPHRMGLLLRSSQSCFEDRQTPPTACQHRPTNAAAAAKQPTLLTACTLLLCTAAVHSLERYDPAGTATSAPKLLLLLWICHTKATAAHAPTCCRPRSCCPQTGSRPSKRHSHPHFSPTSWLCSFAISCPQESPPVPSPQTAHLLAATATAAPNSKPLPICSHALQTLSIPNLCPSHPGPPLPTRTHAAALLLLSHLPSQFQM